MPVDAILLIAVILHIVIGFVLVRKYLQTPDVGFIWLGVAVVVWPLMSRFIDVGVRLSIDHLVHHQPVFFPFSLVEKGQMSIGSVMRLLAMSQQLMGVCLLLIAVLYLARTKSIANVAH